MLRKAILSLALLCSSMNGYTSEKVNSDPIQIQKEINEKNALKATVCVRTTQHRSGGLFSNFIKNNNSIEDFLKQNNLPETMGRIENKNGNEYDIAWFGTAFAYKEDADYVYFATNWHVAGKEENEDFFFGQLLQQKTEVVDDYEDDFSMDDLELEYVNGISTKDMVVLRAKKDKVALYNAQVDEYNKHQKSLGKKEQIESFKGKIGNSKDLSLGDRVVMYGYPHASSKVRSTGKIIDNYYPMYWPGIWDHDSFMTDATSAPGNSGSAVLKENENGDLEWVGNLNAGFKDGDNLNFVIGIDNYKELLNTPHQIEKNADLRRLIENGVALPKDYHKIFGDIGTIEKDAQGNVHLKIYKDFPYSDKEYIEFIDSPVYGSLDRLVSSSVNVKNEYSMNGLNPFLKKYIQDLYITSQKIVGLSGYKHKLERVPIQTSFENNELKKVNTELLILEQRFGSLYNAVKINLKEEEKKSRW